MLALVYLVNEACTEVPANPYSRRNRTSQRDSPMSSRSPMFFHGSHPNTTNDRFRRSFICHFVGAEAQRFEPAQGTHMSHLAP